MKMLLRLVCALIVAGASAGRDFPLAHTKPATTPAFLVDTSRTFHFELGRGSGQSGLDTISFGSDGVVTLFRQTRGASWQKTTIKIDTSAISRVFECVRGEAVMSLAAAYHSDVKDGAQWVLWITQDTHSKAIYLNNYFPEAVRKLAKLIDTEMSAARIDSATWSDVPASQHRPHEKALWNSIK